MSVLNIPSTVEDPNYRYKMPKLRAKIEGRGNGIRTNIMNMCDISRSLKRSPEYVTKFCGHELGSQSKYEGSEGKAIVNGAHQERDLQVIIDKFIEKFVLCPNCNLPEVDLVVKGRVKGKCNACGFSGDLDNAHKLATYIIKYPPSAGDSTMGKGSVSKSKKDEKPKKEKSSSKKGGDEELSSRGSEDMDQKKSKKKASSATSKEDGVKKDKEEKHHHHHHRHHKEEGKEKSSSSKHHHKSKRGSDSSREAKQVDSDDNAPEKLSFDSEEVEQLRNRLMVTISRSTDIPPEILASEMHSLQVSQGFDANIRAYLTFGALCCGGECTSAVVKSKMTYIKVLLDKRYVKEENICAGLEEVLERKSPSSWSDFSGILWALYDQEILSEDFIMSFYSCKENECNENGQTNIVRAKALMHAKQFVDWLEQADTESSSDEDDDQALLLSKGSSESSLNNVLDIAAQQQVVTSTDDKQQQLVQSS